VKQYIILNTSRKHVNYEEDKNKVPMNNPYNIQNTNICNGIFHISFFKPLLINEGETTRGERESGRTGIGAKRLTGWTGFGAKRPGTCTTGYLLLQYYYWQILYLFNLNITVKHTFFIFLAFAIENLNFMNDTFESFIVLN
jgi:hypothetical protein